MLTENRTVKQERAGRRRWFEDDELELIVWYQAAGESSVKKACISSGAGGKPVRSKVTRRRSVRLSATNTGFRP